MSPLTVLRRLLIGAVTLLIALVLTSCGSGSDEPSSSGSDEESAAADYEPVTIEHAFGETTFEEAPQRVATWGWGSADATLALGVEPVAIPAESYAGDENGLLPWIKEHLEAEGMDTPTILTAGEEPPYEELIKAKPDVIFAHYSGITQEQYDKLAKIAPTVAYPDQPWSTPWRDVITTVGEVLGKSDEAQQVLDDIEAGVAEQAEAHPEFEGKTIAAVADAAGTFYVYKPADPRVQFLEDLGFESAPSVDELSTDESTFYFTISREETDKLTSDVLLSYADDQSQADAFAKASSTKAMPQYQAGTIAQVTGAPLVSSVSPPTALSVDYSLDEFVAELSKAAKAAE